VDLGNIFGTRVRLHWSFLLLLAVVIFTPFGGTGIAAGLQTALLISAVFGCVLLHEFGHVFAARYFGIQTRDITLYPIGGVASLESIPRKPHQEFIVAIAGPLVNVVIAGVLAVLLVATTTVNLPDASIAALNKTGMVPFAMQLLSINVALVLFNMIPAFPMDGGRVLRSLLAAFTTHERATNIAATIGQAMAIAFGLFGIYTGQFMLVFIAVFIYFAAANEKRASEYFASTPELARVMRPFYAIAPNTPLGSIPREMLVEQPDLPVVQEGRLLGMVTGADIHSYLDMGRDAPMAGTVMRQDVVVAEITENIETVTRRLSASDQQSLPVLKEHGLVGLILRRDLLSLDGTAVV
jgi:Zn-dependent protease